MVRRTPQELAAARKVRAAEREAEREAAEVEARAEAERISWLIEAKDRREQLVSVADGLYEELEKHARKWPTMTVTKRTVERVNMLLGETRKLLEGENDDFAAGLEDIVPAGDLPETRDVVMLLREVRDALDRFTAAHDSEWDAIERRARTQRAY